MLIAGRSVYFIIFLEAANSAAAMPEAAETFTYKAESVTSHVTGLPFYPLLLQGTTETAKKSLQAP